MKISSGVSRCHMGDESIEIVQYFTYAEIFAVNAYLFKYFKYAKG